MKATKDNIDLGNVVTTAGCPAFGYVPDQSAYVARRLTDAGAIPIGKTNLDQFATGLVGTRSPYGIPQNRYNHRFIPGGVERGFGIRGGP